MARILGLIGLALFLQTLIGVLSPVSSQPNICKNPRLDSLSYAADQQLWFFTSGGYYWLIKAEEFPPKPSQAQKLTDKNPSLTKGEGAVYVNTLNGCADSKTAVGKRQEREIWVVEKTPEGNALFINDLRSKDAKVWPKTNSSSDKTIGRARVDWTKSIDAMFVYKVTTIFVIQGDKYGAIDFKENCENTENFAKDYPQQSTTDFQTDKDILAMTMISDNKLLMFQEDNQYFELNIKSFDTNTGKVSAGKSNAMTISTDFFKFKADCSDWGDSASNPEPTGGPDAGSNPPGGEIPPPGGRPPAAQATSGAPGDTGGGGGAGDGGVATTEGSKDGGGGMMWILIVVAIVVVLIVIALIAFLLMRKKKSDSDPENAAKEGAKGTEGTDVSAAAGATGGSVATKSSVDGKADDGTKIGSKGSPSKFDSKVGGGPAGSKVSPSKLDSKAGGSEVSSSKAGSKLGASSSMGGASPSKMSVRSVASSTGGAKSKI